MSIAETTALLEDEDIQSVIHPRYSFISINVSKDQSKYQSNDVSELFPSEIWAEEHSKSDKQNTNSNTCSFIGGIICIIIAVIDWVTMSEVIQSSEQNNYNKPFLMRFLVNSFYSLMIIPWVCVYSLNKRLVANNMTFTHWRSPHPETQSHSAQASEYVNNVSEFLDKSFTAELVITHKINKFHIFLSVVFINFISISSGYIWYLSLSRTVASINNTIFQSNCVFVLIYSYFLLGEQLNFTKFFSSIICIIGVALISFSSKSNQSSSTNDSHSIIGIILCLLSMMLFALFEVLFKYFGHKFFRFGYELSDTLLFQSAIGLSTLLLFWPFIILLNYLQFEIFELPQTYDELINGILLPCFLDFLFTSSLLCGITFCGALFMSIGLILVIPVSFFSDIIIFKKVSVHIINIYSVTGAICIIIGFIIIQKTHGAATPVKSRK
eukprot:196672_1